VRNITTFGFWKNSRRNFCTLKKYVYLNEMKFYFFFQRRFYEQFMFVTQPFSPQSAQMLRSVWTRFSKAGKNKNVLQCTSHKAWKQTMQWLTRLLHHVQSLIHRKDYFQSSWDIKHIDSNESRHGLFSRCYWLHGLMAKHVKVQILGR